MQHIKPHGINDKPFGSGSMCMLSIGIFLSLHFSVDGKLFWKTIKPQSGRKFFSRLSIVARTRHQLHAHQITFSTLSFQQCFENIQTKAKITWFLGHVFQGSIPSSYSSYELFHSSTKHTLSLSPLHGAQGGSAQSKSFRKYQREGQGRTYTLFPSLHLFPCLSLPRCIALS